MEIFEEKICYLLWIKMLNHTLKLISLINFKFSLINYINGKGL